MITQLGGWTVRRRLGRGGMGTVYHCTNTLVPSIQAAVKTMDPRLSRSRTNRARFIREAEVLFTLNHPHIVKVRNIQMAHDPPFLEMEFVEGRNLGSILGDGGITVGGAVSLAAQMCSALHHMHGRGVFHRDIKPDNIILSGEQAKLVDFGLVTEDDNATLSRPGALFGTLPYVPPEWGGSSRPDGGAWDRYSLGVVILEACTGRPAFIQPTEGTFVEKLAHVQDAKNAQPYLDPGPALPTAIREVVRWLTARDPEDRVGDLAHTADSLGQLRAGMSDADAACPIGRSAPAVRDRGLSETWTATLAEAPPSVQRAPHIGVGLTAVPEQWDDGLSLTNSLVHELVDEGTTLGQASKGGTDAPLDTTTSEPSHGRSSRRVAGLAGVCLLLAAVGVGWSAGLFEPPPPPPAPTPTPTLKLLLSPENPGLPVHLTINGVVFQQGETPEVAAGSHTLRIVLGTDCDGDPLPTHCAEQIEQFAVDTIGTGSTRRVRLPDVVTRVVTLEPIADMLIRGRLPTGDWTDISSRAELMALSPGRYTAQIQAGVCPDVPCGETCASTCTEAEISFVVPFKDAGPVSVPVQIARPTIPASPRSVGLPALVSVGRFSKWLDHNPDYQPGGTHTASLSKRYLKGWRGSAPPDALASGAPISAQTPVEAVSPVVARKVCAPSGGLRKVDAEPLTWIVPDGGSTPWLEIRAGSSGTVLLQSDGSIIPFSGSDARPMVGFRCQQ